MRTADIRRVMMGAVAAAAIGIAAPSVVAAQGTGGGAAGGAGTAQTVEADDVDDDDDTDLGWIGLLGLAGLLGLRRREPTVVHRDTVHTDPRR